MLRVTCPECGLRADLSVFLDAAEFSQALAAALELPAPLASRIVRYLRLFSPPKKALAQRKAARLLGELALAIRTGEVQRKGQVWAAPLPVWERALDAVLERPPAVLPLESHGYLLAAVASESLKAAAGAERRSEEQARSRPAFGARDSPAANPVQELAGELRTLRMLEAANPGVHGEAIAAVQRRLAELHNVATSPSHLSTSTESA